MPNAQCQMPNTILIGAHVSTAGGIELAPKRAKDIGCNCLQIFCSNPRAWTVRDIPDEKFVLYNTNMASLEMRATVIHAQYLVNLASDNPDLVAKAKVSIACDLRACAKIGAVGVVVHVGSHQGRGWNAVKEQVAREISDLLEHSPEGAVFLIENSAGQNGKIGSDLHEIRWMLDTIKGGAKLGWCLDSCHAFAAGYPPTRMAGEKYLFDTIAELDLIPSLKALHVNDSRDPYLSRKDRHANLLDGTMGEENLRAFAGYPAFAPLPHILEVPDIGEIGLGEKEVKKLKAFVQ